MAVDDRGGSATVFVSNVLSGTVTRFELAVHKTNPADPISLVGEEQIASNYPHRGDPNALALGPGGLAFDASTGTLYVASEADDTIYAIKNAAKRTTDQGTGAVLVHDDTHLHGPMGLAMAPNGDLVVANGDGNNADPNQPSELVEYNKKGQFMTQISVDPANGGAFGLAISSAFKSMAAVDDNGPSLKIYKF
jgi:DNA-binding beta-propeller fold protein YncE